MKGRLTHDVEGYFFGQTGLLDLIKNALGQAGVHIKVGPFHLRLGAKGAVELANVGQLDVNSFKRRLDMAEFVVPRHKTFPQAGSDHTWSRARTLSTLKFFFSSRLTGPER